MPIAHRGNPMRVLAVGLWAFLASAWLTGCGGSSGDPMPAGAAVVKTPTVTDIQADRLSYRQITQFKVTGTALDTSVTASARNCSGLVAVAPTVTVPGGSASSTELNWRCTPTATGTAAVELQIKGAGASLLKSQTFAIPEPQVTMVTSLGSLVIELNPTSAPVTVDNFLQYVRDGFYTNTLFHRVIGGSLYLPFGVLLGTVEIYACNSTELELSLGTLTGAEAAFGDYSVGRWCWHARNFKPLVKPIHMLGHQGIWTEDL